jgi:Cu+-exporting ATPase
MKVIDPVCKMRIEDKDAAGTTTYKGITYYFCSRHCKERFDEDPDAFLGKEVPEPPKTGAIYTCPMHPEIEQEGPGSCPKCGMALEPRAVSLEEENPELIDMTRRFKVGLVLTIPLVLIAMRDYIPGLPLEGLISHEAMKWVELILATPVVLWAGWPFFVRLEQSILNRSLNMFTLIGLGVGVAYIYSVVATLIPGVFP